MKKLISICYCALVIQLTIAQSTHTYSLDADVLWASPDGFDLTMDIYKPLTGKASYPVLIIFHGGGWLINNKSIMNQMSDYVASNGEYVVCNVNYRLLGDQDNSVTMDEIVEDAFGAVLWIKENIKSYGGNPKKIAVTGDSAGGHLASMVIVMGQNLSESGFEGEQLGFTPTYMPKGKTVKELISKNSLDVQAGVISYGAFDIYAASMGGFEDPANFFWQMGGATARPIFWNASMADSITVDTRPDFYKMVSPIYNVPDASDRPLPPQFFHVGSLDNTTTPESIEAYMDSLKSKGHAVSYWVHDGRPHAYLDSGSNPYLGIKFEDDAIPALEKIMEFLDGIFY